MADYIKTLEARVEELEARLHEKTVEVDVELEDGSFERRPATLAYVHTLGGRKYLAHVEPLTDPDTELVCHRLGRPPLIVRTQLRK